MQREVSTRTWGSGSLVRRYRTRSLRPPEAVLLDRYGDRLRGRVLELGCGAGRLTGHLIALGGAVHGVDIAPRMVAYCRRTYPSASFAPGDVRDAAGWGSGPWEAIVAGWALIDILSDGERAAFLAEVRQRLTPDGIFIFSTHNLACAPLIRGPLGSISAENPVSLASQVLRLPRSYRNRRRLARFERVEPDYAILNAAAHDFSLLHYYIGRDAQEEQLRRHAFTLLACVDAQGREVAAGEDAPQSPELHYAARPADGAPEAA